MQVKDYYYQHFNELSDEKKFHFATRMKNFCGAQDFNDFFATYQPSSDLEEILKNNDYSKVNRAEERRPFFEKYDSLFAIEAALFRVMHLLHEYNVDLREDFKKLVPLERLYQLSDDLLSDDAAIITLSTWAVNVICLTEALFPRGKNVVKTLAEKSLSYADSAGDPLLLVYLYTHIIICDSEFYVKPLSGPALARKMLDKAAKIILSSPDDLILDVKIEFLVCAKMANAEYPEIRESVAKECREILKNSPFLFDTKVSKQRQTFDGAEHTNVLYIMSGLDAE